jgi:hypothetical protein
MPPDKMPKKRLSKGLFLDLTMRDRTASAAALVDAVVATLDERDRSRGLKPRRRGDHRKAAIRACIAAIVGSVLRAWAASPPIPVHRALNANSFSNSPIGYRVFIGVLNGVKDAGFIWKRAGYLKKERSGTGRASRFWPSHTLLRLAARHGVDRQTVSRDFKRVALLRRARRPKVHQPVVLRAIKEHPNAPQPRAGRLDMMNPLAAMLVEDVIAQNRLAAITAVEGCPPPAWRREFKVDLAAHLYGRWHAVGDGNYQQIPEAERLLFRINGEAVAEIDIKGSLLTLLHGVIGIPAPESDPYLLPGVDRDTTKLWVNATLGKGTPATRWPRGRKTKKAGPAAAPAMSASAVGALAVMRYPFLKEPWWAARHLAHLGEPKRLLHHMLTGIESKIVTDVMRNLRHNGVLSLPMHDGLIVPVSAANTAQELLTEAGERIGRVRLRLTVDSAWTV